MVKIKKIMNENMNKFSFAQMTSNSDGKTSGSGTAGIYLVGIGGITGLMGAVCALCSVPHASEVLLFATGAFTTGATLLGYRKSKDGSIEITEPNTSEVVGETPPVI